MPEPRNVVIECDLIDPPNDACKIKSTKVERLAKSIEQNGLLQPPGVVVDEERYRIVYGHHRFHAWLKLGHSEIEVRVLPSGTSAEQELSISLQENHAREDEDFFDTLARVEKRAKQRGCKFKEAAKLEGVKHSYISRVKRIYTRIDGKMLEEAIGKEVGFSVLYAISGTDDEKLQRFCLDGYLAGTMNRDAIEKAIKKKKSVRSRKKLTLRRKTRVSEQIMKLDEGASYDDAVGELDRWKRELRTNERNGIPLEYVNKVKKKGEKDVVQEA